MAQFEKGLVMRVVVSIDGMLPLDVTVYKLSLSMLSVFHQMARQALKIRCLEINKTLNRCTAVHILVRYV